MKEESNCISFHDKYTHIIKQKQTISPYYSQLLPELSIFENVHQPWRESHPTDPILLAKAIQLQTLYKLSMPLIYSLDWSEQIHYKTTNPITAIVAFKQIGQQYHSIDQYIVTWVESGGTKVVPLRSNTSKQKIMATLKVVSALVIPDFKSQSEIPFLKDLAEAIKEDKELPVMAMGNSAVIIMSQINNCEQLRKKVKFDSKMIQELQVFASHCDTFFSNLNLKTRLQLQAKPKIMSSNIQLDIPSYLLASNNHDFTLLSLAKSKNQQYSILLAKQQLIHYCFFNPKLDATNMESVTFGHKVIVSFIDEIRKRMKNIDEKQVEVGQHKMILKGQRYIYNCDLKLGKI